MTGLDGEDRIVETYTESPVPGAARRQSLRLGGRLAVAGQHQPRPISWSRWSSRQVMQRTWHQLPVSTLADRNSDYLTGQQNHQNFGDDTMRGWGPGWKRTVQVRCRRCPASDGDGALVEELVDGVQRVGGVDVGVAE